MGVSPSAKALTSFQKVLHSDLVGIETEALRDHVEMGLVGKRHLRSAEAAKRAPPGRCSYKPSTHP